MRFYPILIVAFFLGSLSVSADEFWRAGFIGNWNNIANWNNAVPAVGADINARARDGGTINMNSVIDTTGVIDIRLSDTDNDPLVTLNWNPGAGSTPQFIERIRLSDNPTGPATSQMNHQSGHIRLDADWFHIGRRGVATYNASGSASVAVDDRISIAEGAGNVDTTGSAVMSGNSQVISTSGNESFIAVRNNAKGYLTMYDNSYIDSKHWRIANDNGSLATIELNGSATFRAGHGDGQVSLGRSGQATMTLNDTSSIELQNNTSLRIGDNNNGVGHLTLNGASRIQGIGNGNAHVVVGDDGTGKGTLIMNNASGIDDNRVVWIGNSGSSDGTVIMNNDSFMNLNVGDRSLRMSQGGTGDSTLIMNDNASITTRALGADQGQGTSGGVATIVQNQDSKITTTGWTEIGGGNNDVSTWTLNDSSQVNATATTSIGMRANGTGVLTLNDTSFYQASLNGGEFRVASQDNSRGIVNVNQDAFLHARGNLLVAVNNGSIGTFNQNGGTVRTDNTLFLGGGSGQATYSLTGGTLRTDRIDIRSTGTFDWGAGTLTMREVNRGSNGNGIEIEVVGAGNNLATSAGSILDLGDVYTSNGNNWDTLDMNGGTLDLSAAGDTLEIWRYVSSFRPGGSNTSATYEIKLINSPNIVGEFDNLTGPGPDFQYFGVYSSAQVATLGLTPANVPRNRGFIDYRADGAYFVFNVAGQVPEPSTGLFLLFGTLMLRGVSVVRRNQRIRKNYTA